MRGRIGFRKVGFRRVGIDWATFLAGGGLSVANGQLFASIAAWSTTVTRYFFVDYDSGSDANTGYIDATAGTTFTALQLTSIPFKTIERLLQVLPRFGNGRKCVVLIKPRAAGATYRNIADNADDSLDLTGVGGFAYFSARGSTDLTNSASDRITLGAIQGQAGPGGAGEWTAAGGATTTSVPVAAGALTAEPGLIGMRIRFDAATTTAALRNTSTMILANTAGTITTSTALAAAPAAGDIFYIERPGVRVATCQAPDLALPVAAGSAPVALAGIAVSGTIAAGCALRSTGLLQCCFLETTGSTTNPVVVDGGGGQFLTVQHQYPDETGAFITGGVGLRTAGGVSLTLGVGVRNILRSAHLHTSASVTINAVSGQWTGYAQAGFSLATVGDSGGAFTVGSTTAGIPRSRILSGTLRLAGRAMVRALDVTNATAAAITIGSSAVSDISRSGMYSIDDVVGSTGNTGVGIDASNAVGATITFGRAAANTVSGTAGEIKLTGGVVTTHAAFTLTGFTDPAGNKLYGTAGAISGEAQQITNKNGGALGVGDVVRGNGTSAQAVKAQADTAANSSGVFGVMVTPPANDAAGFMVTTGVAYTLFAAAPGVGAIAYLSQATAGQATGTVPPVAATNQKLRLGIHVQTISGNNSLLRLGLELFPVVSNGAAP